MKVYIADSNIFLRFFLQDNPAQAATAEDYFRKAQKKQIEVRVISEIIPEIEYVLSKVYKEKREDIFNWISSVLKSQYLKVEQREIWLRVISIYSKTKIDIVDALLMIKRNVDGGIILSFDKDFKKLEKLASEN